MLEILDHGNVREIRLSRPPVNALSPELLRSLREAIATAVSADRRALVLSGRAGLFTAGLDVPLLLTLSREQMKPFWRDFHGAMEDIARCPIPIVAAITGHSPAGGTVLAIFCDYRVAALGEFRMGLNEVRVGLPVSQHILQAYGRLVGEHTMETLASNGIMVSSEQALEIGLVDELHEVEDTIPAAVDYATGLAELPRHAMSTTRMFARSSLIRLFDEKPAIDVDALNDVWFSEETQTTMHDLVRRLKDK